MNRFASAVFALLVASAAACAQITLVDDHRHVELSANGQFGEELCADLDQQQSLVPFQQLAIQGHVACQTAATSAGASARILSGFSTSALLVTGHSEATARADESSASSAFGTAHSIVDFRVDAPVSFRLTGRIVTASAECHVLLTDDLGQVIIDFTTDEAELLLREIGELQPGDYHIEIEGTSLAASTPDAAPDSSADYDARLEVVAGTACTADYNFDGTVTPDDLAAFVLDYFQAPSPDGLRDIDATGQIDADDLGDFITAFYSGC